MGGKSFMRMNHFKFNKLSLVTVLICLTVLTLTACGTEQRLMIGVNEGYAAFGFSEDGQKKGFESELMQKIAEEAKFQIQLQSRSGGEILSELKTRKLDAGIAGITIKESRRKTVDFSTPYLQTGQRMAVRTSRNDIHTTNDLAKKTVGAKIGTSGYEYASKVDGVKEVRAFQKIEEAFRALEHGKIDALIYDSPGIEHFAKQHGTIKATGKLLTSEHYAIALPKGSKYTSRINNALKALGEDGTFERLYKKWFNEKPQSLPRE